MWRSKVKIRHGLADGGSVQLDRLVAKVQPLESFDSFMHRMGVRIRSLEDFVAEERQCGLPSLPARDPRFPQPPVYLCDKIL